MSEISRIVEIKTVKYYDILITQSGYIYIKEKYQEVTLLLTRACVALWEQIRCIHISVSCHFKYCMVSRRGHSTLKHSLVIFTVYHLALVKNDTAGMVTTTAQLGHMLWAEIDYVA